MPNKIVGLIWYDSENWVGMVLGPTGIDKSIVRMPNKRQVIEKFRDYGCTHYRQRVPLADGPLKEFEI